MCIIKVSFKCESIKEEISHMYEEININNACILCVIHIGSHHYYYS